VLREGTNNLPEGEWEPQVQQPIPWCTAHDAPLDRESYDDNVCYARLGVALGIQQCTISVGGPDHKWWVDV